jgi:8-oxo-dGTP diphosphatase
VIKKRDMLIPACYLMLLDGSKILLSRRYNTGYEDGNYSLVAGHVDQEESFTECMIREANEEAGITLHSQDVTFSHLMHRNRDTSEKVGRVDIFFIVRKWQGEVVNKEPNKCDDLSWFELDALPDNLIHHVRVAIEKSLKSESYSEDGFELR